MPDESGIYVDESRPCTECGAPTNRIDANFECALCIGCVPKAWAAWASYDDHVCHPDYECDNPDHALLFDGQGGPDVD